MKRDEVLRSIQEDLLEYIQKKVTVEYDNHRQRPVSFLYDGRTHRIDQALDRFRMVETQPVNAFLVCTDGGQVYCLVFQPHDVDGCPPIQAGFWVLSFRVLEDGELMALYRADRKTVVDNTFKRVVEFHGRLCPDLVLGKKLCECLIKRHASGGGPDGEWSVVAENRTPALDAIQVMLGVTLGNRRLRIMDSGRHRYTFLPETGQGAIRLSLKRHHDSNAAEYRLLAKKLETRQGTLDEMVHFQVLLDARVKHLMHLSPEDLFDVEPIHSGCVHRSLH